MSKPIIEVRNISKVYRLGEIGITSLREEAGRGLRKLKSKFTSNGKEESDKPAGDFWALKDVSFDVQPGEVVGIIGKNGAGKSTLLKVISRITEPSHGEIRLRGRVAALLEVGTGFHPELTGRENIYLNGTILGMKKREIDRKLDEIIDFSGIEKHIDTPVKRYSSGMNVRLGFAVAAHLEPEILIVDEVLAVGDAEFQKKCLGKMKDVAGHGRTVLFVSHNMGAVKNLCKRTLVIERGSTVFDDDADAGIDYYTRPIFDTQPGYLISDLDSTNLKDGPFRLRNVVVKDHEGKLSSTLDAQKGGFLELSYELLESLGQYRINIAFLTIDETVVLVTTNHEDESVQPRSKGFHAIQIWIPQNLLNSREYLVRVNAGIPDVRSLYDPQVVLKFLVRNAVAHGSTLRSEGWPGVVAPKLLWNLV